MVPDAPRPGDRRPANGDPIDTAVPRRPWRLISTRPVQALLVGLLVIPAGGPLTAQSAPESGPAGARIELEAGLTRLRAETTGMAGARVLVGLGRGLWVGGAGYVSARVDYLPPTGGQAQIGLGYGGVVFDWDILDRALGRWSGSLLLGGGNADASDPVVGVELGSDNFAVIWPSLRLRRPLYGPFNIGAEVGYRFSLGVQDVPGIENGSLSGPSLGVTLEVVRR